ncbi:hypothetical protein JCM39068_35950 [Desulfocastanea catecholica]
MTLPFLVPAQVGLKETILDELVKNPYLVQEDVHYKYLALTLTIRNLKMQ